MIDEVEGEGEGEGADRMRDAWTALGRDGYELMLFG